MEREQATEMRDLPHKFEAGEDGRCKACRRSQGSSLHQEQSERASEASATLERERGT